MSDPWRPSASPPPPPSGPQPPRAAPDDVYRPTTQPTPRSGAFRDTLIVAGIAVAGVVGLLVWSGGEPSAESGFTTVPDSIADGQTGAPQADGATDQLTTTGQAQTEAADATASPATAAIPAAPADAAGAGVAAQLELPDDPAAYEAMVTARDAFIAALPAPAGGAEQVPNGAGVRTWLFPGTDWESVRNAYLAVLQPLGFVATPYLSVNEGGAVGELLVLSDPTGTVHVQLATATQGGQTVIEVTRQ